MFKKAFDSQKYLQKQKDKILERISTFDGKLYLEFGGKLFEDFHAARVLPGYDPNNKIHLLTELKDQVEIIIAVNADNIANSKERQDLGIPYDQEVFRLIDAFRSLNLYLGSVVITRYQNQPAADAFRQSLTRHGIPSYLHYPIEGYPVEVEKIVSKEGLGKNDYIQTSRNLIVVTAPGPGSGKMATCISQLYHDHLHHIKSGYAKFETFPVWNLPLIHAVNRAYEAATADLDDVNMLDPYHLEAYGEQAVNYNRDIEIFPVLKQLFVKIQGSCPYHSPTDMGVNMVGFCITDHEAATEAAKQEILRRYFQTLVAKAQGKVSSNAVSKLELLLNHIEARPEDRTVVSKARIKADETKAPAMALELNDGRIVLGKTSSLFGPSAALIINALKSLANIDEKTLLIQPEFIKPIQKLKTEYLGNHNPRLHSDELLMALVIISKDNQTITKALEQLSQLKGCQAHSTVILPEEDGNVFRKLGVDVTFDPQYTQKKLYHGK
ncbi:hypothetical protein HMPREF9013_0264 [Bulleidia extructa W1219]|uniref:Uncharacterized protein n=1 Tax=Bulleidia extructa W1219 TaxID=679192 RepID=D2MP39_9FIRM|nr:DUF1846 domain-containing protein [Bulleidia extructa]EFC05659.1 hypothetical protein HMPREF9013_0264 [Bulleidia extructa W1219]